MRKLRDLSTSLMALVVVPMLLAGLSRPAAAQECGREYVVQEGDSLARIARTVYGQAASWTIIFYANQDRLGAGNSLLVPGLSIRIPCVGQETNLPPAATVEAIPAAPAPITTSSSLRRVEFLTASGYAPFTERALENGGMLTEVVTAAMERLKAEATTPIEYNISWVNDWAAHLNPLLRNRAFDLGFPWFQPPCEQFNQLDEDSQMRCQSFFFSEPLFEPLILLFVRKDSTFEFNSDGEILGRTLCRPAGYFVFDLNQDGRNWLSENRITLLRPQSVEECFRLLVDGRIDGVALNEFTGRAALASLGLSNQVKAIERPLAISALRVTVPKTHPHARTLLYYVNSALRRLREDGEYDRIIDRHLTAYWEQLAEEERARTAEQAPKAEGGSSSAN
ncbi:MAG: transporter substrate-binding domain-containing protein [Rhizobiales bacterium]|nr:transporter substrate-binding domain-containing protein [Hyphomicrobiales bacterium]